LKYTLLHASTTDNYPFTWVLKKINLDIKNWQHAVD